MAHRRTPSINKPYLIGSGAKRAKTILHNEPGISPYNVLLKVIEDDSVQDVGGVPQIITIDQIGVEIVGVIKEGERYLFGRKLASLGHKTKVRYITYHSDEL